MKKTNFFINQTIRIKSSGKIEEDDMSKLINEFTSAVLDFSSNPNIAPQENMMALCIMMDTVMQIVFKMDCALSAQSFNNMRKEDGIDIIDADTVAHHIQQTNDLRERCLSVINGHADNSVNAIKIVANGTSLEDAMLALGASQDDIDSAKRRARKVMSEMESSHE